MEASGAETGATEAEAAWGSWRTLGVERHAAAVLARLPRALTTAPSSAGLEACLQALTPPDRTLTPTPTPTPDL